MPKCTISTWVLRLDGCGNDFLKKFKNQNISTVYFLKQFNFFLTCNVHSGTCVYLSGAFEIYAGIKSKLSFMNSVMS